MISNKKDNDTIDSIDFDYWDEWIEYQKSRQDELSAEEQKHLRQVIALYHKPNALTKEKERKREVRRRKSRSKKEAKWRARRADQLEVERIRYKNKDGSEISAIMDYFNLKDDKTGRKQAASAKSKIYQAARERAEYRATKVVSAIDEGGKVCKPTSSKAERIENYKTLFKIDEKTHVLAEARNIPPSEAEDLIPDEDHIIIDINGDLVDLDKILKS